MKKKTTSIPVYAEDVVRLIRLKRLRDMVPKKKPGRGRGPNYIETHADVFKRAVDALERAQKEGE